MKTESAGNSPIRTETSGNISIEEEQEDDDLALPTVQSKMIVINENERYSPMSGWSSSALGLSDPSPFTLVDSSAGWSSLGEASKAMLSRGWNYWGGVNPGPDAALGKWKVDTTSSNVDADGWSYATDFSEQLSSGGSAEKSIRHFVRWRRRVNYQFFEVSSICIGSEQFTCDHCDRREVERLAALLLLKVGQAYARSSPKQHSEARFVEVKNESFRHLGIFDSKAERQPYSYAAVEQRLTAFAEQCSSSSGSGSGGISSSSVVGIDRNSGPSSPINSFASYAVSTSELQQALEARLPDIEGSFFTMAERQQVAMLIIRKLDSNFEFHCDQQHCGSDCAGRFAPMRCGNSGCGQVFSRRWEAEHAAQCPERQVPCTAGCGASLRWRTLQRHLEYECALRPVRCPFAELGCHAELTGADVQAHVDEAQGEHLELALFRLRSQESTISNLTGHVRELQVAVRQQQEWMAQIVSSLASASATPRLMSVGGGEGSGQAFAGGASDQQQQLQQQQLKIKGVEQQCGKNTSAIASVSTQVGRLQQQVALLEGRAGGSGGGGGGGGGEAGMFTPVKGQSGTPVSQASPLLQHFAGLKMPGSRSRSSTGTTSASER